MKMKEFGPQGGGGRTSLASPLDPSKKPAFLTTFSPGPAPYIDNKRI